MDLKIIFVEDLSFTYHINNIPSEGIKLLGSVIRFNNKFKIIIIILCICATPFRI